MSEFTEQPNISLTDDLNAEVVLDLSELADEPSGGALPVAWYAAEIIEGYSTRKGRQMTTSDLPSNDGSSRNLFICFKLTPPKGEPRNLQISFNYRLADFTPQRQAYVKQARIDNKDVKGAWQNRDDQRSSLSLAKLGLFGKATKIGIPLAGGQIVAGKYIGTKLDVHLTINEKGYNDANSYDEAGNKTPKPKA